MIITNVKTAIEFLYRQRGTNTADLSKFKYRVFDEDFSFYCSTDKELIDYAKEQQQDMEENEK